MARKAALFKHTSVY